MILKQRFGIFALAAVLFVFGPGEMLWAQRPNPPQGDGQTSGSEDESGTLGVACRGVVHLHSAPFSCYI